MKIGINLVGVSYHDGSRYRYRNFKDAFEGFTQNITKPLLEQGHSVDYYTFTYNSEKDQEVLDTYKPKKFKFLFSEYNNLGGGDKLNNGIKIISQAYMDSLKEILNEDLDLVISTRFDISFIKNPFVEYDYEFNKCNYLWREPEFTHLPIVSDTFIVFPHKMTQNLIDAILEMETNPPHGVGVAMHNIYLTMCNQVGKENVKIVCDEFKRSDRNDLFKLTRKE
jgi:hypothetical protein